MERDSEPYLEGDKSGKLEEKISKFTPEEDLIIRSLKRGANESVPIKVLKEYIKENSGEELSIKEIYKTLKNLEDKGIVKEHSKREINEFYISPFWGAHEKRSLQNLGWYRNLSRYFTKGLGAILILFGIGVFVYRTISPSGAVIASADLKLDNFILPIASMALGVVLIFNSFKK
ncbi:hypothetical protein M0R19_00055 [Candidatus Pacearchaeota archaeon]|jgi:hypothetical protein|nr:hypothetical protein [Candidatus Pacearchaeota archaeon]